ncbi:hypothetical protein V5E97_19010 [Singulisphaera sp. Ch08]|uniref:Tetratricopeptide repeat protein n=1 Tax=Singulisphaera sp. Ch08 TaxID=3120278 RepID=A0AAU7CRH3_9BACT
MPSVASTLFVMVVVSQATARTAPVPGLEGLDGYQAAAAKAGKIPDAHVRLALWCESRGMIAARDTHLAESLKFNPSHVTARGLLGQVREEARWLRFDEVAAQVQADPKLVARLAAYDRERDLAGDSADDHLALGAWCAKHGLMAESRAHYAATVRRDPARAEAWRKLGYRARDGRWVNETETARARRQFTEAKEAYRSWATRLARLRGGLDSPQRRDAVKAELAKVHDPLATPCVWSTFVNGGAPYHEIATRLFAQINGPDSTSRLALLAVFNSDAAVQDRAVEALVQRDPREYVGPVISLLREPMRIVTRPIRGPGSPGAIFVDGVLVREYYEPLPDQFLAPFGRQVVDMPWAIDPGAVAYCFTGLAPGRTYSVTYSPNDPAVVRAFQQALANPAGAPQVLAAAVATAAPPPPVHFNVTVPTFPLKVNQDTDRAIISSRLFPGEVGAASLAFADDRDDREKERERDKEREAAEKERERARREAEQRYKDAVKRVHDQFQADRLSLEAYNREIERGTRGAAALLQAVTGRESGLDRDAWSRWWADWNATEDVAPLARELTTAALIGPPNLRIKSGFHRSRLAAGTSVWTTRGRRPVEAVRIGDRLLGQDPRTGALAYTGVVATTGGARVEAIRITLEEGGSLTLSPMARVWRPEFGWVPTFRVKVGDQLRIAGGRVSVSAVDRIGLVAGYNVLLFDGGSLLVGDRALLVHDNGIVLPPSKPFDAPPLLSPKSVAKPR